MLTLAPSPHADGVDADHGAPPVAFQARVAQRWMIAARMHPRRFREIVPAPFLEPVTSRGGLVLSLCCVHMEHAAPAWLPLEQGPSGLVCALRIACRDRSGAACTWIARRHTDPALAGAMRAAGLPQVDGGLVGRGRDDLLDLRADDGLLVARVAPGHGPTPQLFSDAPQAAATLMAAGRSYTTGSDGGWIAVGLQRDGQGACEHCAGWEGWLRTPWGDCTIDGVYRMPGGLIRWSLLGQVDAEGRHV